MKYLPQYALAVIACLALCFLVYDGCSGKHKVTYGRVVDKEHVVDTDDKGNKTHTYRMKVVMYHTGDSVWAKCTERQYNRVQLGASVQVSSFYGGVTGAIWSVKIEKDYVPSPEGTGL